MQILILLQRIFTLWAQKFDKAANGNAGEEIHKWRSALHIYSYEYRGKKKLAVITKSKELVTPVEFTADQYKYLA